MSTPLRAVLGAVAAGARSRADVSRRTGIAPDLVEVAVEHLVRLGRLEKRAVRFGCPARGCGSCRFGPGEDPSACAPAALDTGSVLYELGLASSPVSDTSALPATGTFHA